MVSPLELNKVAVRTQMRKKEDEPLVRTRSTQAPAANDNYAFGLARVVWLISKAPYEQGYATDDKYMNQRKSRKSST